MAILLKTESVRVSSIQIMQVRVQNKGKSVWKSRYDGDVSVVSTDLDGTLFNVNVAVSNAYPQNDSGRSVRDIIDRPISNKVRL